MKILPAITTKTKSAWRDKVKEVKDLGLKEVALFPTCLKQEERKQLYQLLKQTKVERIPFVHIRNDMEPWEMDYLIEHYQTEVFNTHTEREFPFLYNLDKYKKTIYIENCLYPFDEKELQEFGGICLDFSHLENARVFQPARYQQNIKLIEKYPVGCSHISPAKNFPMLNKKDKAFPEEPHYLNDLSELDYLKRYPLEYFGPLTALEFENNIRLQLKAKEYIINLLKLSHLEN